MFREYYLFYKECAKTLKKERTQSLSEALRNMEFKRRVMSIALLVASVFFILFMFLSLLINKRCIIILCIINFVLMMLTWILLCIYDNKRIEVSRFVNMDSRIEYLDALCEKMGNPDNEKNYLYPIESIEHYDSLMNDAVKERDLIKERIDNFSKIVSFIFSIIVTIGIEKLTGNKLLTFAVLIIEYGILGYWIKGVIDEKKIKPYNDFIDDIHSIIEYEKGYYGGKYKYSKNKRETQ